jgi:hypothetical protein
MMDWYDEHRENPYPTMEEKDIIAEETGLTTKQVRPKRKEKTHFRLLTPIRSIIIFGIEERRKSKPSSGRLKRTSRLDDELRETSFE